MDTNFENCSVGMNNLFSALLRPITAGKLQKKGDDAHYLQEEVTQTQFVIREEQGRYRMKKQMRGLVLVMVCGVALMMYGDGWTAEAPL